MTLTVGSLFCGVGGFDIAAERAGMNVVWQSEFDKNASKVLEHYWPGRNLGDIHNIRIRGVDGVESGGDRVSGGTVTDAFTSRPTNSTDNGGTDDIRIRLDTGREPEPRDIGAGESGRASDLPDGGTDERYAPTVDVLCGGFPCQDYSVAGNREGLAGDRGALWWQYHRLITQGKPTWVVAENVPGLLSSRNGQDFATIIDSLTELGYGVVWTICDAQYFGLAQRRRRVFIVGHSGGKPRPEILALSEGLFGYPAPGRETGQTIAGTIESRPTDQRQRYEENHLNIGKHSTVRRLTPLECERLQGFPDGWTDIPGASDSARYKQMGNAVAVPVVEWIMKRIATAG